MGNPWHLAVVVTKKPLLGAAFYCKMFPFFETPGADFYSFATGKSGPLEIGLSASFPDRVKLGGTDSVGVAAPHA